MCPRYTPRGLATKSLARVLLSHMSPIIVSSGEGLVTNVTEILRDGYAEAPSLLVVINEDVACHAALLCRLRSAGRTVDGQQVSFPMFPRSNGSACEDLIRRERRGHT
jgi:hypothetical protein